MPGKWMRFGLAAMAIGVASVAHGQTASAIAAAAPALDAQMQLARMQPDQQVKWLREAASSGALERMDDAQLAALFESLNQETLRRYIQEGPNGYPSYEFTMWRQERVNGKWPDQADHMRVRIAHDPLRIYAKWLPDGAHAGQEVLYDESKRTRESYGHLGGVFGVFSIWSPIDGSFAKAQSNHTIRDLGTEYIAHLFLSEGVKFNRAGVTGPARVDVRTLGGSRVVALTYEAPREIAGLYAHKVTLGLDLRRPWFRSVETFGGDGEPLENIVIEQLAPKTFDDMTFDSKNREYKF